MQKIRSIINRLEEVYMLKNIIRYNTRTHIKDESVAEHSFYVALLALMICDEYKIDNINIRNAALTKAILHDMPEIELNDITHDVKERLHLREFMEEHENEYYRRNFPDEYTLMTTLQNNTVGIIVDLADALSVIQYSENEIRLGNRTNQMMEINREAYSRVAKYTDSLNEIMSTKEMEEQRYESNK